jgi:hypothetical protein
MRFLASWWERIPLRLAAPTLLAIMVGAGSVGYASHYFSKALGFSWT